MNRKGIPNWTPEEVEYLRNAWGHTSYEGMANALHRSVDGIREKASRLGLGRFYSNGEYVTLNQKRDSTGSAERSRAIWPEQVDALRAVGSVWDSRR